MTGWPMRTRPWMACALGLGLALACAPGAARADRILSNSQLLGRAVRGALDSTLVAAPFRKSESVVILPAHGQASDWALENEISTWLLRRVARLTFHGVLEDSVAVEAEADSVAADSGETAPVKPVRKVDRRPLDPTADLLEYRVAVLGVEYTGLHKSRLFGAGEVDRLALVSVGLRLLTPEGALLWSGHARGQAQDRIPQARLPEVQDRLFTMKPPVLPNRSLTKLLEPAIVVGLVTGLVFLFYTNRN
jgi:hypothetical protein